MALGYRFWKIAGNPSDIYDHLENWDISESPHTKRKDDRWFFYVKRKSYQSYWNKAWVDVSQKWRITDIYTEDNSWCEWWECVKYYYAVNQDRTRYTIIKRSCDWCTFSAVDTWERCACWEDRFFDVLWPKDNLNAFNSIQWEIYNQDSFWYINLNVWTNVLNPWDYIFIRDVSWWNAVCWQARQVLFIDWSWDLQFPNRVQLSSPRTNVNTGEVLTWANVIVTSDIGNVAWYYTSNWIRTLSWWEYLSQICDYWIGNCIQSIQNHNWTLTYLTEQWYNFYGWVGFDSNSISATNSNNVWWNKIQSVSFKNFLVFFWKREISTIVFDQTWTSSFYYDLRKDIWIHNRWAYSIFDNGLYFIGSDNRIYWASITWQNWFFDLQLEDITKNIFMHMDLVQENDEVYMSSEWWRLYIFINWRDFDWNSRTNKTKILIYDKTYWQWLVHTICGEVITWYKDWDFYGDEIYKYWGRDWDWNSFKPYTAIAEALLYKNDNSELKDQSWLPLDMFRRHKLMKWVFLLWMWKYRKETTYIQVDKYDEYKYSRAYWIDDNHSVIKNWDDAMDDNVIEPSECFINSLWKCDNIKNEYTGSHKNYKVKKTLCWWIEERRVFEDYCIKYDDNAYALSPIHKFQINFDENYADYWRVSFICWWDDSWNDIAYFGWMILQTDTDNDFFVDVDPFTTECCEKIKYCPKNWC